MEGAGKREGGSRMGVSKVFGGGAGAGKGRGYE